MSQYSWNMKSKVHWMISKLELDFFKEDDLLLIAPLIADEDLGDPATSDEAGAFDDLARDALRSAFRS